jgi:hypothetical protein
MRRLLMTVLMPAMWMVACTDDSPAPSGAASDDYLPDVPIAYDGLYLAGSFEDAQGFGWDTCYTRTPGKVGHPQTPSAQGNWHVAFESGACDGTCAPTNPSASHLYAWFTTTPSATAKMGIYFDAVNAGGDAPTGALRFYGTDTVCEQESLLAEIELSRLQLSSSWSTRCVTVTGPGAAQAIGVAATGGTHKIGIDALRLGAPCHASP